MDCAATYCRSKNPSGQAYAQCGGYAIRTISPADVTAYAQRSGATDPNQLCFVTSCLVTGRLVYWKNTPGDCPTQTKIDLGAAAKANTAVKIGSAGLSLYGAAFGVGAKAGLFSALPSLPAAATGIGLAIAIPLAVWGIISAHHKIAVAKEQATICDVSQAYDAWEQTAEYAIATGSMIAADVKAAVPQVEAQLMQALQAILKQCNAACFMQKGLKALNLYGVEKLYDSLSPHAQTISNPANPSQYPVTTASRIKSYGIAGAGAYGAVKLVGALL